MFYNNRFICKHKCLLLVAIRYVYWFSWFLSDMCMHTHTQTYSLFTKLPSNIIRLLDFWNLQIRAISYAKFFLDYLWSIIFLFLLWNLLSYAYAKWNVNWANCAIFDDRGLNKLKTGHSVSKGICCFAKIRRTEGASGTVRLFYFLVEGSSKTLHLPSLDSAGET